MEIKRARRQPVMTESDATAWSTQGVSYNEALQFGHVLGDTQRNGKL